MNRYEATVPANVTPSITWNQWLYTPPSKEQWVLARWDSEDSTVGRLVRACGCDCCVYDITGNTLLCPVEWAEAPPDLVREAQAIHEGK